VEEDIKEGLSALVDGEDGALEIDDLKLLQQITQSEELLLMWARYHLISDSLKGGLGHILSYDLRKNIRKILDESFEIHT
jgi:negative regulator of sigma E activity